MIFQWDMIEKGPGTYDWSSIDGWVADITSQGKWGGLRINTYDGQCCGGLAIPQHVVQAHPAAVLTCPSGAQIPRYWDAGYRAAFQELVRRFGARYNGDSRIAWIEISNGVFGETAPSESIYFDCLQAAGLTSEMWVDFVKWTVDVYRAAFPNTELLLQYAPRFLDRSERKEFTDYAASLGVGLKHNGLRPDAETDAYITDANLRIYQAGQYDPLALWGDHVPTAFEGAEGSYLADRTATMWGLYNALDKHVDYLVLDTQLVSAPDRLDLLQFAAKYAGHTAADTPSAWAALRDSDPSANPKPWFPDYGNFEFWLYQNDAVRAAGPCRCGR